MKLTFLLIFVALSAVTGALMPNQSPNPNNPAVLYLPLGGSGIPQCLPSAGAKLAQLVPLMFAGMTFTIFDAVATGEPIYDFFYYE